ncbi:hypothetical protein B484DRAFT_399890, partial [Ochromonadaceae sp. CCMP2298]
MFSAREEVGTAAAEGAQILLPGDVQESSIIPDLAAPAAASAALATQLQKRVETEAYFKERGQNKMPKDWVGDGRTKFSWKNMTLAEQVTARINLPWVRGIDTATGNSLRDINWTEKDRPRNTTRLFETVHSMAALANERSAATHKTGAGRTHIIVLEFQDRVEANVARKTSSKPHRRNSVQANLTSAYSSSQVQDRNAEHKAKRARGNSVHHRESMSDMVVRNGLPMIG